MKMKSIRITGGGEGMKSGNKDIAQIFGDMIASSNRQRQGPLSEKGERSGLVMISEGDREAMLEAMAQIHCRHVDFGTYKCYGETNLGLCVDYCLVPEINRLNNTEGVRTVGCCCGHGRKQGYVQVEEKWIEKMIELGYEPLPPEDGNDYLIFKPKTSLPKPSTVLAPESKSEIQKLKESIEFFEEENLKLRKEILLHTGKDAHVVFEWIPEKEREQ